MKWEKRGLIYKPKSELYWQKSHAALPTILYLGRDVYRVFFTSRDLENRTYVGYFDWLIGDPGEIIGYSDEPILLAGRMGTFDFQGVQATSVIKCDNKLFLYYLGWTKAEPSPLFYTSIGLAISLDCGDTFQKHSEAPIMERSKYDPWMVSGGTVKVENGLWRMWYLSGISFEIIDGKPRSKYNIKYAESLDGINWNREGVIAIDLRDDETNISRLSIIEEDGLYKAWFPFKKRSMGYRIGYAESIDGIRWERMDVDVGIDVSSDSWDSEALDKVEVLKHKGKKYMLYNGNEFGKGGIGLAVFKQ